MIKLIKTDVDFVRLIYDYDYDYCSNNKGETWIKTYAKLDEAIRDFSKSSNEILEDIVKNGITENLTLNLELGVDGLKLMETKHKIDNWGQ